MTEDKIIEANITWAYTKIGLYVGWLLNLVFALFALAIVIAVYLGLYIWAKHLGVFG